MDGEKSRIMLGEEEPSSQLPRPENYTEPTDYPKFEVARVVPGGIKERYSFGTEQEARGYMAFVSQSSFCGSVDVIRWDDESQGEPVIPITRIG